MEIDDLDLVLRAKQNDRHAFSVLVRRYQSPLRLFLRRFCAGDDALADDLAQEAFIKAYQALKGFRGDSAFKSWLYRIGYNVMVSYHRKHKSEANGLQADTDLDSIAEQLERPRYESELFKRDLAQAVGQLTKDQQLIFYLSLQSGFTHQEVASITGMPLGTVKSHANRARVKLQQLLSAWQQEVSYESR